MARHDEGSLEALISLGLFGLLLYFYVRERRSRGRSGSASAAAQTALPVAAAAPEGTTADTARPQPSAEDTAPGRSPNWAAPLVYCAVLLGIATHPDDLWGLLWHTVFLAAVGLGAYTTFSDAEWRRELARDPTATRTSHYLMFGVPYVLFPVAGWVLVAIAGWRPGVLVPALPWAFLLAYGAGSLARAR